MVKVNKFYVEAKKSGNFQTYTAGVEVELEEGASVERVEEVIREYQQRCRKLCVEQISIDKVKK